MNEMVTAIDKLIQHLLSKDDMEGLELLSLVFKSQNRALMDTLPTPTPEELRRMVPDA